MYPVSSFVPIVTMASTIAGTSIGTSIARVGGEPDEEEEDGREQIAQRGEHPLRVLGRPARDGDADEEGADRGRHVRPCCEAGDQQPRARAPRAAARPRPCDQTSFDTSAAVTQRDVEDERRPRRGRSRPTTVPASSPIADQQSRQHRQVERHREVLDHEQRQHHGRLAVGQSARDPAASWRPRRRTTPM